MKDSLLSSNNMDKIRLIMKKKNVIFKVVFAGCMILSTIHANATSPVSDQIQTQGPVYIETFPKRDIPQNCRQYVVMIGGAPDANSNRTFDLQNVWHLHSLLKNHFNIPSQNFFIAFTDGGDTGVDGFPNFDTNPDFDSDGINDITHAADKTGIENLFDELAETITPDDHLLICYTGLGGKDAATGEAYLSLWNHTRLYPEELSVLINQLDCNTITFLLAQSNSGGFIDALKGPDRFIMAACDADEAVGATSDGKYLSFLKAWIDGMSLRNNSEYFAADSDYDGYVSVYEGYLYARNHDFCSIYYKGTDTGEKITTPKFSYDQVDKDFIKEIGIDRQPHALELVIRDNKTDNGILTANAPILRESPDIWIRNFDDDEIQDESPIFASSLPTNYVYVQIINRGKREYDPSKARRYLHVYWSVANPAVPYTIFTGRLANESGQRYGGAVKSILLKDPIPAKGAYVVSLPWIQKKNDALHPGDGVNLFAYVSDNPYGLEYDAYLGKYDGLTPSTPANCPEKFTFMAQKNMMSPADDYSTSWEKDFYLTNPTKEDKYFDLKFENINYSDALSALNLSIVLPDELRLVQPQSNPNARIVYDPDSIQIVHTYNPVLSSFLLSPDKTHRLKLRGSIANKSYNGSTDFNVSLIDHFTGSKFGSYSFYSHLSGGAFSATCLGIYYMPKRFGYFNLIGHYDSTDFEPDAVEWTTPDGKVLGTSFNIDVNALETPRVILKTKSGSKTIEKAIDLSCEYTITNVTSTSDAEYCIEINLPAKNGMVINAVSASGNGQAINEICTQGEYNHTIRLSNLPKGVVIISLMDADETLITSKSIMNN